MNEFKSISKERSLELYQELIDVFREVAEGDSSILMDDMTITLAEKKIPKTMIEAIVLGTMLFHLGETLKSISISTKGHYEMPKGN